MNITDFAEQFADKMEEIKAFVEGDDIKDILGTEAVNHYKESFHSEGFTDETLNPWAEVKRREPTSPWYGHSGQTGKFSNARTSSKILSGETKELQNSITFDHIAYGARIKSDKPYAAVHQFGGLAKI